MKGELVEVVTWVLVFGFILLLLGSAILGVISGTKEATAAQKFCKESGWEGVRTHGGFFTTYSCYRYVDGFYEQSPKIKVPT